jgi:DNA topoisomerase-2
VPVEPEWYIPIIPIILVNGTSGIGTGFSTSIPCYNPKDIIDNIHRMMNNDKPKSMIPWYNKFKGTITKVTEGEYLSHGTYEVINETTIHISELPIGTWTSPYKEYLEELDEKKDYITGYTSNITDEKVSFTISLKNKLDTDTICQKLKLVSKFSTKNMHLYNSTGRIHKYDTTNDILKEFYDTRLMMYVKRKEYIINKLQYELDVLQYKIKFIEYILDKKIIIERQKKENIIQKLVHYKFPQLDTSFRSKDASYDYLTNMYLFSLTEEKIEELKKKIDNKEEELKTVKSTTEIEMWKRELDELVLKYEEQLKQETPTVKKSKKKVKA